MFGSTSRDHYTILISGTRQLPTQTPYLKTSVTSEEIQALRTPLLVETRKSVPTDIRTQDPRNIVAIASVVVNANSAKSNVHITIRIQCLEAVEDVVRAVGRIFLATITMQA